MFLLELLLTHSLHNLHKPSTPLKTDGFLPKRDVNETNIGFVFLEANQRWS